MKGEKEMSVFETLQKEARYALDSKSRDLVFETYGKAKMALSLGAITYEEFMELNTMLIRSGINNSAADLK